MTYAYERRPVRVVFQDASGFKETYGGSLDVIVLQGQHLRPAKPSDTVLISMHPIGGTAGLPVVSWLAEQGLHVLACDSRYRGADYALIMEKVLLDLGAVVRYAKEKLGYRHVALLGWSGGGSLSAFYQSQAEHPSITQTPAGDPVDLKGAGLIPADAVLFVAAHISRHEILTDALDASIRNEADPEDRDPQLDLYGGGVTLPLSDDFLVRYRAAQVERNRRITAKVKEKLAWLRAAGRENEEFAFVTHGTMADPRWVDPMVDPNDRRPGWCYLGDPGIVNMSPIGFARYSSLRSWLSQWSIDDARGDGPSNIATTSAPVLVINNSADDACAPSHARRLFDATPHENKAMHQILGATHYYERQPELGRQAASIIDTWLGQQGLVDA